MIDYKIIDDEYEEYEDFEERLIDYLVALAGLCQQKDICAFTKKNIDSEDEAMSIDETEQSDDE